MKALFFHPSGKPRGWLRRVLLQDGAGTPRRWARRILFHRDGRIRARFDLWYSRFDANPAFPLRQEWQDRVTAAAPALAQARHLVILAPPRLAHAAQGLAEVLQSSRLAVTMANRWTGDEAADLVIVISPQVFDRLPPPERTIHVQTEQNHLSRWFTAEYLARLSRSLAVWDYALDNIRALQDRGLPQKQLFHVPLQPRPAPKGAPELARDIDVLFYGDPSSPRRRAYLDALAQRFALVTVTDTFGPAMAALLHRARVVVNIHMQDQALLETPRLAEALSHGARVVSEVACDQHLQSAPWPGVQFCPAGDIAGFCDSVAAALAAPPPDPPGPPDLMRFMVLRALQGLGVFTDGEFDKLTRDIPLPSDHLILSLPEAVDRHEAMLAQQPPGTAVFPGLRHPVGWQGCARSYRYLAQKALDQRWPSLTIQEDDARLAPDGTARLKRIRAHLNGRFDWDLFSGLLSDLDGQARVLDVTEAAGETFVTLDRMMGMVFGIYRPAALQALARHPGAGLTIDRHLNNQGLRCITPLRPLVRHDEAALSTIWPAANAEMAAKIERSQARLAAKVAQWRDG